MPKGAKIELATNVPIYGTLTYADYAKATKPEYSPQLRLTGKWDGQGEGYIYLSIHLLDQLVPQGLVKVTGGLDRFSQPKFEVINPQQRVALMRWEYKEDNKQKKITFVVPQGAPWPELNAVRNLPNVVLPTIPENGTAPAVAAPASSAGPGMPPSAPRTAPVVAPVPAAAPANTEDRRDWTRKRFAVLQETGRACVRSALKILTEELGIERRDVDQVALARFAGTLMIRTEREGFEAWPGMVEKVAAPTAVASPTATVVPKPQPQPVGPDAQYDPDDDESALPF